jgi:hypothetical protein
VQMAASTCACLLRKLGIARRSHWLPTYTRWRHTPVPVPD